MFFPAISQETYCTFVNTFNSFNIILGDIGIPNAKGIVNFRHYKASINFPNNIWFKTMTFTKDRANQRINALNNMLHMFIKFELVIQHNTQNPSLIGATNFSILKIQIIIITVKLGVVNVIISNNHNIGFIPINIYTIINGPLSDLINLRRDKLK